MAKKWLWVINLKWLWALNKKRNDFGSKMKIDSRWRALSSKWKRKEMSLGHKWKSTLGPKFYALNGKEMTLGHKWKTTLGWELWALNGKKKWLGHKRKMTLGQELLALNVKRKIDFGS